MQTQKKEIKLRLMTPLLGSLPGNKELLTDYIASKAPTQPQTAEEILSVPEMMEKGTTVFARDGDGFLHLWDYHVKGFIKEITGVFVNLGELGLSKWTYKRIVDDIVFVYPRRLYFEVDGQRIKAPSCICERPLRAETMQGERVAIARSEQVNVGTIIRFELEVLKSTNAKAKHSLLTLDGIIDGLRQYGPRKGMGQWRNSGMGRVEIIE